MCQRDPIHILWQYLGLSHPLQTADVIVGFGSYDTATAERAAKLWLQSLAPVLLFTGGFGKGTEGFFTEAEGDVYAKIALGMGVPATHILIDTKATHSGENITFSKQLLQSANITPTRMIAVHKPYMGRRLYAALCKQWPGPEIIIAPSSETYSQHRERFVTSGGSEAEIIHSMVGDLQRIALFPSHGYQIAQDIPTEVWNAYHTLVAQGFTKYLLQDI